MMTARAKKVNPLYPAENPYFAAKGFELLFDKKNVAHLRKLKDTSVIARNGREIIEHWHALVVAGKIGRVLLGSEVARMLATSTIPIRCSVPPTRIFQDYMARLCKQGLMRRVEVDLDL